MGKYNILIIHNYILKNYEQIYNTSILYLIDLQFEI